MELNDQDYECSTSCTNPAEEGRCPGRIHTSSAKFACPTGCDRGPQCRSLVQSRHEPSAAPGAPSVARLVRRRGLHRTARFRHAGLRPGCIHGLCSFHALGGSGQRDDGPPPGIGRPAFGNSRNHPHGRLIDYRFGHLNRLGSPPRRRRAGWPRIRTLPVRLRARPHQRDESMRNRLNGRFRRGAVARWLEQLSWTRQGG